MLGTMYRVQTFFFSKRFLQHTGNASIDEYLLEHFKST